MQNRKIKLKIFLYAFLVLTILFFGMIGILIYGFESKNNWIIKMGKIIPFPAVIVEEKKWISIVEFSENSNSVKQFYENQDFSRVGLRVDFNTPDGQKRLRIREKEVLGKMIEDKAILILAEKEGIEVVEKDLEDNVDKKLDEYGNRDNVKEELMRLYGWKIEDFKEKIVKPSLYRERLIKVYEEKYQDTEVARKKIEEAENLITKREKSFSEAVSQFSEGSTAETGGELGWFKEDQIIPEIAGRIFSLRKGERSSILESQLGFHIVEMEEKKVEDGEELIRIRQIFAAKKTFAQWIGEKMKTMNVRILLKDYSWNKETLRVEFSDQTMKNFEEEAKKDPKGDASVIF